MTATALAEHERVTAAAHALLCVPDCPWNGDSILGETVTA